MSVLVPTRNSMAQLPEHLASMRPWLDLAEQVVVVDSHSTDGSMEFLKANLPADRTLFLTHPPGLYQSWNFGIGHMRSAYTYISTVGDPITREGLVHLHAVAEKFSADVVVSPPAFVNARGQAIRGNPWPVHRIISLLNLREEICLQGLVPFVAAVSFLPFALLGSSASNLHRTSTLQERPFPTDYGMNGDGAWGVANALDVKMVITPKCFTQFRKHRKSYSTAEYAVAHSDQHIFNLGTRTLAEALAKNPELVREAARIDLQKYLDAKAQVQHWRTEVFRHRDTLKPRGLWIFRPAAWNARFRRIAAQRVCDELIRQLLLTSMR